MLLTLENIYKTYKPDLFKKRIQALSNLSFSVAQGQVFGLIGPNGAGKSTTIRIVLGLTRPDRGSISFFGKPLKDVAIQREIGYLSENPYLYDHLTLDELLTFSGRASGLSAEQIRRQSQALVERLDLQSARKRPLRTFSKGMLQRAAICFALLHDPSVVILDEPMSGLDPIGRRMVFDLVTDLKREGKTIFFCSHILTDVERLCDRIGLMVKGRLVRTFDRESFADPEGTALHLVVSPLSEGQKRSLAPLVTVVAEERGRHVVSLPTANLAVVADELQTMGAEVLASRSNRISLEEIFMQAVEESR